MTTDEIWLTPEAHAKLLDEHEYLIGKGREEVTARIAFAREEGDLSENAGYHAAREEPRSQVAGNCVCRERFIICNL